MNVAIMSVGCGNPDDVASRGISRLKLAILRTGKNGTPLELRYTAQAEIVARRTIAEDYCEKSRLDQTKIALRFWSYQAAKMLGNSLEFPGIICYALHPCSVMIFWNYT